MAVKISAWKAREGWGKYADLVGGGGGGKGKQNHFPLHQLLVFHLLIFDIHWDTSPWNAEKISTLDLHPLFLKMRAALSGVRTGWKISQRDEEFGVRATRRKLFFYSPLLQIQIF